MSLWGLLSQPIQTVVDLTSKSDHQTETNTTAEPALNNLAVFAEHSLASFSSWLADTSTEITEQMTRSLDLLVDELDATEGPRLVEPLEPGPSSVPEGVLAELAEEMTLHLFSFLDIASLSHVGATSKKFMLLHNNNDLWKALYLREANRWKFVQSITSRGTTLKKSISSAGEHIYNVLVGTDGFDSQKLSSIGTSTRQFYNRFVNSEQNEEVIEEETPKWKDKYRLQHIYNTQKQAEMFNKSAPVVSNHERKLERFDPWGLNEVSTTLVNAFTPKVFKVLLVGQGLETSGKKLVYEMMWGDHTRFEMTNLFPGKDGKGSGVGFLVNGVTINCSACYYDSYDGITKWKSMFQEADAVCFIMDSYGNLDLAQMEMQALIQPDSGLRPHVPLILLPCQPADDLLVEEFSVQEILDHMNIETLTRPWAIQKICVANLDGVWQAMVWLLQTSGCI